MTKDNQFISQKVAQGAKQNIVIIRALDKRLSSIQGMLLEGEQGEAYRAIKQLRKIMKAEA